MPLPKAPGARIHVVADRTSGSKCDEGFLRVRRRTLRIDYDDGTTSREFPYDEAWRVNLDAVAIIAWYLDARGERRLYLRTAIRPPIALRPRDALTQREDATRGVVWELPAGLIEADEQGEDGLKRCAARELEEEIGIPVDSKTFALLGSGLFPTPAVIAERIFFLHVEVDPKARGTPAGDGSPLEHGAAIADVSLEEALAMVRRGVIDDMKTEIGIRRFAELAKPA